MSREHNVTEGGLELIQAALPGGPRVYENKKGVPPASGNRKAR